MNGETGQNIKNVIGDRFNLFTIAKGIFAAYIITIPMFLIFAYILTYTNYPQRLISPVVIIVTAISILIAGSSVTKSIKSKGWLNGAIVGFVYMFVLYLVSSIVFGSFAIDSHVVTVSGIGIITGVIGGIIGVNFRKTAKHKYKRI